MGCGPNAGLVFEHQKLAGALQYLCALSVAPDIKPSMHLGEFSGGVDV